MTRIYPRVTRMFQYFQINQCDTLHWVYIKVGIQRTYLSIIKTIYDKITANIIHNNEKLKDSPLRSRTGQGCPLVLEVLATTIIQEKEIKGIQIWTGRSKTVTAGDMILQIENPKDTIKTLLELINEFHKVAGYKINIQKSIVFLYTKEKKTIRKGNQENNLIYNHIKKIPRSEYNKGGKRPILREL